MFFCCLFAAHGKPPTAIDDPAGDFAAQRSPPAESPMTTLVREQRKFIERLLEQEEALGSKAASALVPLDANVSPLRDWRKELAEAFAAEAKHDTELARIQQEIDKHRQAQIGGYKQVLATVSGSLSGS